jgi:hypothetical protein
VIKDSVLDLIERFITERGPEFEFNLVEYFLIQQSNIIINVMIGRG